MQGAALITRGRLVLGMAVVIVAAVPLLPANPAWPLDTPEARATLKHISRLRVRVDVDAPGMESVGITGDRLQADTESRLRQSGIALADPNLPTAPVLWVIVTTDKVPELDLYAASVKVALFQYVRLPRDWEIGAPAATWELEAVGSLPTKDLSEIRSWVQDFVDRFISAYLEQNPKH